MDTVNSLSGGKTSSYIAMNYPADHELFSLVCIDDHNAAGKLKYDKKLMQYANDKLQKYCSHMPAFRATAEDPKILKVMLDLEQLLGREIVWVRGIGFETLIQTVKKAVPNMAKRFCTTELKLKPIFDWCFINTALPVQMRIGFRYDEKERADKFKSNFDFVSHMEFQPKSVRWIQRWVKDFYWREPDFPLIDNKVIHLMVQRFWNDYAIEFPEDSNCQMCFWKDVQQLRKNFDNNKPIMLWAGVMESLMEYTFKEEMSMLSIKKIGLQQGFEFGTGSGCQAGFCTD